MARKSAQQENNHRWTTVRRAEAFCAVARMSNWQTASIEIGGSPRHRTAWHLVEEFARDLRPHNPPALFETVKTDDRSRPEMTVRLTAEGELALPFARQLVSAASSLRSVLRSHSAELRLACYPAHLRRVVAPLHASGETTVNVVAADDALRERAGAPLFDMLSNRKADVVIAPERVEQGIASLQLYQWHLVAVIPKRHALAASTGPVTVTDLSDCRLLLSPPNHASRKIVDEAFPGGANPYYENASTESLLAYVEAGLGVAILPQDALWPSREHRIERPFLPDQYQWHSLHWRAGEESTDERLSRLVSVLAANPSPDAEA